MKNNCILCGKETETGEPYCPQCLDKSGARRPRSFWFFSIFFSALLLVLAGMMLWHGRIGAWDLSWDRLLGRPVAMINGETVSRKDLKVRMKTSTYILEQRYGKDVFTGKDGKARLVALQKEILEGLVEERLIAQEAQRLGIRISDERVEQELRRIAGEIYGSPEDFQKSFREDGISEESLKNHIRHILTTEAMIKIKSASPDTGIQPEASFAAWLTQAKKAAKVVVYDSSVPVAAASFRGFGCCGSGGSAGLRATDIKKGEK